jgi:hypothetical protein
LIDFKLRKMSKIENSSVHHSTWLLCMLSYLWNLEDLNQYSGQLRWVSGIIGIGPPPSPQWVITKITVTGQEYAKIVNEPKTHNNSRITTDYIVGFLMNLVPAENLKQRMSIFT